MLLKEKNSTLPRRHESQSAVNEVYEKSIGRGLTSQFTDNRPTAIVQRELQEKGDNRIQMIQLKAFQAMTNHYSKAKQFPTPAHLPKRQAPIQRFDDPGLVEGTSK